MEGKLENWQESMDPWQFYKSLFRYNLSQAHLHPHVDRLVLPDAACYTTVRITKTPSCWQMNIKYRLRCLAAKHHTERGVSDLQHIQSSSFTSSGCPRNRSGTHSPACGLGFSVQAMKKTRLWPLWLEISDFLATAPLQYYVRLANLFPNSDLNRSSLKGRK